MIFQRAESDRAEVVYRVFARRPGRLILRPNREALRHSMGRPSVCVSPSFCFRKIPIFPCIGSARPWVGQQDHDLRGGRRSGQVIYSEKDQRQVCVELTEKSEAALEKLVAICS
jgi:hypothetical protein